MTLTNAEVLLVTRAMRVYVNGLQAVTAAEDPQRRAAEFMLKRLRRELTEQNIQLDLVAPPQEPVGATFILINSKTRKRIEPGHAIRTFRGEKGKFIRITRVPVVGGSQGKVLVKLNDFEFEQELYPSAIGAEFQEVK